MIIKIFKKRLVDKNLPISNGAFSQLQKEILQGKLKAGAKLTEQAICEKYNISRTPVREAIRQLEVEGLVEIIPNRGAFVVGFSYQDLLDMLELQREYEVQAIKWAIQRITDEEKEDLEEAFEFMEFYTQKNDLDKMFTINMNFHQLIYRAAHNRMLEQTLSLYQTYIKHSRKPMPYPEHYLEDLLEEHGLVFDAIMNKDMDMGIKAMRYHMDKTIERFRMHNII